VQRVHQLTGEAGGAAKLEFTQLDNLSVKGKEAQLNCTYSTNKYNS